ncbi:hypothetical protein A3Q56_07143 [Intoshia linei]|uniref:Uncharacterized protein n=1 Tax=Intoshia linei TaxID=1819745 RepID=A0A177AT17_9BILA|nr:hypothetical protein A3Q56_07143 [Intoshia linei]
MSITGNTRIILIKLGLSFVIFLASILSSLIPWIIHRIKNRYRSKDLDEKATKATFISPIQENNHMHLCCSSLPKKIEKPVILQDNSNSHDHPHSSSNNCWIERFIFFSGGVFLSTYLLHMQPEVTHSFSNLDWDIEYPIGEAFTLIGFFIVMIMPIIAKKIRQSKETVPSNKNSTELTNLEKIRDFDSDPSHSLDFSDENPRISTPVQYHKSNLHSSQEIDNCEHFDENTELNINTILIICVLAIHRIFEGLSLGISETVNASVFIAIAICTHEIAMGLSWVLTILHTRISNKKFAMLLLGAVTPIIVGVIVGILLFSYSDSIQGFSFNLTLAILRSFSAGTFIYVTFMEIICNHTIDINKFDSFLSLFAGSIFLSILQYFHFEE